MKRDELKAKVNSRLKLMGYDTAQIYWVPNTSRLLVLMADEFKEFAFKASMSQRDFGFQLGRLAAYAEMLGLRAPTAKVNVGTNAPRFTDPEPTHTGL